MCKYSLNRAQALLDMQKLLPHKQLKFIALTIQEFGAMNHSARKSAVALTVAACVVFGLEHTAYGDSNKGRVQAGIAEGGWKVAWGREIRSEDMVEGAAWTYAGGYTGLTLWISKLVKESTEELKKNVGHEFTEAAQEEAARCAEDAIKKLLIGKQGGEVRRRFGNVDFKAGIAEYRYTEKPKLGHWEGDIALYTVPSYQPYVAIKLSDPTSPGLAEGVFVYWRDDDSLLRRGRIVTDATGDGTISEVSYIDATCQAKIIAASGGYLYWRDKDRVLRRSPLGVGDISDTVEQIDDNCIAELIAADGECIYWKDVTKDKDKKDRGVLKKGVVENGKLVKKADLDTHCSAEIIAAANGYLYWSDGDGRLRRKDRWQHTAKGSGH